jgi:hypothetical protein
VGVRDKVRRVRVNRMYFIKLYILGDSKESTTSDQSSDTENDGVRWLFLGLSELIA